MNLRSYQTQGINDLRGQFYSGYKRTCYVGPCGAGKTMVMAFMATEAKKRGKRTIFIVHRQELIEQASETFSRLGIDHAIITSGYPLVEKFIQVASVQTLARRLDKIREPDFLIFDEAHHATAQTWRNVINHFPDAYVVGLTATPARLNGQGLSDVFETLVIGPTAKYLIQHGYLTQYKYYAPPVVADMAGVKTKMGDFDNAETVLRMDRPSVTGDAIQHYQRLAPGSRAIVYCASRAHSEHTAEAFQAAGIIAKHIDGTTPKTERKQAIEDFRAGRITILCNVDLFGEGLDVPGIETVILLRPTQSLTLFIQQSMRGMRPDRSNSFKTAVILDHVGNVFRHGLPDDEREWTLEGRKKQRKSEAGTVAIRACPKCYSVFTPTSICPYCGFEFPTESRKIEEKSGELTEVKFTPAQKKSRHMEVGMARTMDDLKRIAAERGYAPGWVRIQAKLKNIRS